MNAIVVVRLASGTVCKSRRQAHLATAPENGTPDSWQTFCGLNIPAPQAEV
ncbi:hypothetical protein [Saccharopolyspora shandongensis]|uniref:hypothetical protein n=1 Tax=Saccharopolyspora shandongensis TaxID=418495 RepID=UPI003409D956